MTGLLQKDPTKRLGLNGGEEIKRHAFFARYIDWNKLLAKRIPPPFKPSVVSCPPRLHRLGISRALTRAVWQESALDTANFDTDFTSEEAQDSVVEDTILSETVQDQFRGFTYNPANEHLSESVSYPSGMR